MKDNIARAGSKVLEMDVALMIKRISAKRLMEGGAAILVAEMRNHKSVKRGNTDSIPLYRYKLRELLIS